MSTINHKTQRPTNRNVIFRGFVGENEKKDDELQKYLEYLTRISGAPSISLNSKLENDLLVINTDIRTKKVSQLKNNSGCELCWYEILQ